MPVKFPILTVVAMTVAGFGQVAFAASPTIYTLGVSNNGSAASRGYGINDSGQVAVTSTMFFGEGSAQRYDGVPGSGGVLRELGTLPGDQTSASTAINASGQIAGSSNLITDSTATTHSHAFRYDGTPGAGGVMRSLGTLGGGNSQAIGLNNLGQVTGQSQTNPAGPTPGAYAFVYTGTPGAGGVMKSLGSLGGTQSYGTAINDAGQVAGSSTLADDLTTHPFRYDGAPGSGVMRDLGGLPGMNSGGATAINASGQVVGAIGNSTVTHAFVYKGTPGAGGAMTDLGTLPGGTLSVAVGITDSGFVLGQSDSDRPGDPEFYPVLWRPDGSAIDLDKWFRAANPALSAQWNFQDATMTGISNTGLITGGALYLPGGGAFPPENAFVLDASSLLVPEPTGVALVVLSASLLVRRQRSR